METTDAQLPKGQDSDLIQFGTLELHDNSIIHVLKESVAKIEEETYYDVAAVSTKLKLEVSHRESGLEDLGNTENTHIDTQDVEIRVLSDDLADITRHVFKIEDGLVQLQTKLEAKSDIHKKHDLVQTSITARSEGFYTAQVRVEAFFYRL